MRRLLVSLSLVCVVDCGRQESITAPNGAKPEAQPTLAPGTGESLAAPAKTSANPALSAPSPLPTRTSLRASAVVREEDACPFGIASSNLSSKRASGWLPAVHTTGVRWLRGFDVAALESRLTEAASLQLNVSGIFIWGPPGKPLTFPADDSKGWSNHVSGLVTRGKGRVRHWEVWNEPPNFTQDKSPESYAKIVVAAYDAAKNADPTVQVGIAAKSNHVQWLEAAIRAGAKDHFDFVTLHPYEVLDVVDEGGEALFLNIVPTLRKMLRVNNPERAEVPVWFTEVGTPVSTTVSPELQAARLLKAYTLGIAQGAARIHWFEGQDGDSGTFGLMDAAGNKRPSFTALKSLIEALGPTPNYVGWVVPSEGSHGFVFQNAADVVLVAWASSTSPLKSSGKSASVAFGTDVSQLDPTTGVRTRTQRASLTTRPLIFSGLPKTWSEQATTNRSLPFPWGGDFTGARVVSLVAPNIEQGVHQFGEPVIRTFGGKPARDASTRASQSFAVDPNFANYVTGPLTIGVSVRRNGATPAGFKLEYESTTGWKSAEGWYTIPESESFTTKEFTLTDAEFVGNWAYHFMLDSDTKAHSQYSIESVTVTKLATDPRVQAVDQRVR